jgi:hypothetical protein
MGAKLVSFVKIPKFMESTRASAANPTLPPLV